MFIINYKSQHRCIFALSWFACSATSLRHYRTCAAILDLSPATDSEKQRKAVKYSSLTRQTGVCPLESRAYEAVKVEYGERTSGQKRRRYNRRYKCLEYTDLQVIFSAVVGRKSRVTERKTHREGNHESRIVSFPLTRSSVQRSPLRSVRKNNSALRGLCFNVV